MRNRTIGATIGGIAIAIITGAVDRGALTPDTLYDTGLCLGAVSGALFAATRFYRRLMRDVAKLIGDHKAHDRDALTQALTWHGDDSGPQHTVHRIRN